MTESFQYLAQRHINQRLSENHAGSFVLWGNIWGNKIFFLWTNFCPVKLYLGRPKPSVRVERSIGCFFLRLIENQECKKLTHFCHKATSLKLILWKLIYQRTQIVHILIEVLSIPFELTVLSARIQSIDIVYSKR